MKKIVLLLLLVISVTSCVTQQEVVEIDSPATIVYETDDFKIMILYVTPDEARERWGQLSSGNPFIKYPALITHKDVIVFDTYIETKDKEIIISPNTFVLDIDGDDSSSFTKSQHEQMWRQYIDENNEGNFNRILNNNLYAEETLVAPEAPVRRCISFMHNFPEEGEAFLTIHYLRNGSDRTYSETIDLGYFIQAE